MTLKYRRPACSSTPKYIAMAARKSTDARGCHYRAPVALGTHEDENYLHTAIGATLVHHDAIW
jgi:hypothetical protein